ncbi:MAG: hypothetical protein IJ719_10675 [Clostridia bacterium]|nr:hypothetical protein [Clostridia bacterium]
MNRIEQDDMAIDALLKIRRAIDACLENINNSKDPDKGDQLIDIIEEKFLELDGKAQDIFTDLASQYTETYETSELIESKKANT